MKGRAISWITLSHNSWDDFPAGAVERINIGGETGTFVHGTSVNGVYDPISV